MSGSRDATAVTPAWKKLGLKLKHSSADEPANGALAVGQPDRAQHQGSMQGKRKVLHTAGAASDYSSPLSAKKPRRDFSRPSTGDATPQLTRKKSVAFADTPTNKTAAPGSTTARKTPAKPHPKAAAAAGKSGDNKTLTPKKQKKKPQPTADTKPAIDYLRHWVSSRDSWKFNKNHQSTLIKAVFESGIPPADVGSFYDYIDDIKGGVRMRLRETALAIRLKDNTDRGAAFPSGTADPDGKQEIYEAALAGFLEAQQKAASKKRTFAEMDYVTTAQDADVIIRRLVKRMRAEMVIATLSDGESDASTATVRAPVKSTRAAGGLVVDPKTNGVAGKRRRKLRTNVDDSDSSSSSDSSSDDDSDGDSDGDSDARSGSDTSSSGSDDSSSEDEADADEDMEDDSSSSSSSSDDDSDDEDSDDEAEVTSAKGEKASK